MNYQQMRSASEAEEYHRREQKLASDRLRLLQAESALQSALDLVRSVLGHQDTGLNQKMAADAVMGEGVMGLTEKQRAL